MKIYISGQITGLDLSEARKLFNEAEAELKNMGHTPTNPMKETKYDPEWAWRDYMIADIDLLFDCDGIFMLNNYHKSKGARIERHISIETNKIIIYQK